jgi:hypothetical protein
VASLDVKVSRTSIILFPVTTEAGPKLLDEMEQI